MSDVIRRALVSVSDKTGLVEFGKFLADQGIEILSTGGSARALSDAGVPVKEVSSHTGFPEIMDGRVKTLHPKIHGGILARRDLKTHTDAMVEHNIAPIDLVVVNLYPFEATLKSGADYDTCVENIDIGGPGMVRAAAKNHGFVTIVTNPDDYALVQDEIKSNDGATTKETRRKLAATAYSHTAKYDSMISGWLQGECGVDFPRETTIGGELKQSLRYGENPHQVAAVYKSIDARPGVVTAQQLQGKELSYNNLNDTDAAFELVSEFNAPTIAIIKHANPCGVATADNLSDAYKAALACDPTSAFGGIIATNKTMDAATAAQVADLFAEVVIAPAIDDDAKAIFATKKNLRVLVTGEMPNPADTGMTMKTISGGFLLQGRDNGRVTAADLKVVTKRQPTEQEIADMIFAFRVGKHIKSNAIVYAKNGAIVGIGAGQMSRVDSSRIAAWKSNEAAETAGLSEAGTIGSVVSSDAFFPFADGLLAAAEAGATAVIQPGGSMRDDEVIAAADEAGLAMVYTGMRHFRH
ncbi:phosphoribosylaminoimidazolecarboxamide formyltransferase [Kiloniella spongiae]|uniref:Bifunctional purine biosynthesis protein PurH n=1 Tax=Kiloniella spongiae TaxID=1489064 RepID=A0A0H2MEX5_9PROT|nr:bifunctional phosphoribosylaminoimidazolecarboxamide formyltransferase/IMP cyclohydrolase [Kiloniella spongiae]KLN60781.1 phosphoribosylaminoimidazolecarboxamide formyltransferase [Kiloniella spongiae]